MLAFWIVVGVIVVVALYGVVLYNGLVRLRARIEAAWSQIDVQLRRRHDLIPNLVESVKAYAAHERQAFDAVTRARSAAVNATTPHEQAAAENQVTSALRTLFAVSEAYPELKANQNFLALQEELTATEGRVAYARQHYNDTVARYNTKVQSFPGVLVANALHFEEREYFEADDGSRGPVDVRF